MAERGPPQDGRFAADAAAFGANMNSIAHSQAMLAAIRDYSKEAQAAAGAKQQGAGQMGLDVATLLDDAELQKLHEERIARLRADAEKRQEMCRKGHGKLEEISEGEFLETVTKAELVVCHFFHREFERCKVMDKHLTALARRYFTTRFVKLSAPVRGGMRGRSQLSGPCACHAAPGTLLLPVQLLPGTAARTSCPAACMSKRRARSHACVHARMRTRRACHAAHPRTHAHVCMAQDAPFFTVKLAIKTLPCVIFFRHGVVVGQVVGFDGLGGVEDFQTSALEDVMHNAEVRARGRARAVARMLRLCTGSASS